MRNFIYGISSVALLAASMNASAVADDDTKKKRFYGGVQVGLNQIRGGEFDTTGARLWTNRNLAEGIKFGYKWGGLRTELEFNAFQADARLFQSTTLGFATAVGETNAETLMVNVLYDFDVSDKLTPYVGAGFGGRWMEMDGVGNTNGVFTDMKSRRKAYQLIAGLGYDINDNFRAGLDYRYIRSVDEGTQFTTVEGVDFAKLPQHAVFLGVNYFFGEKKTKPVEEVYQPPVREEPAPVVEAEPAPMPEPQPEPEPIVVAVPDDFIIYFDFDSAELDWKAQQVVLAVAEAFKAHGNVTLALMGHADRAGSDAYNEKLSEKRAWAVKMALVEAGVSEAAISASAHGEHDLAVATADGVSNQMNRRVEVMFSLAE